MKDKKAGPTAAMIISDSAVGMTLNALDSSKPQTNSSVPYTLITKAVSPGPQKREIRPAKIQGGMRVLDPMPLFWTERK
jgi:hypothetical protein